MDEILKDERFKHIAGDPRFKKIPRGQKKVKIDKRFQSMFKDKRFKVKYTVDKRGRPINRTSTEDLEKFYDLTSGSEDEESETEEKGKKIVKNADKKPKKSLKAETTSGVKTSGKSAQTKKDKKKGPSLKKAEEIAESEDEEDSSEQDKTDGEESDDDDLGKEDEEEDDSLGVRSDDEEVDDDVKTKLKDMTVDYARGEGAILSDSSSDELTEDSEDDEEDLVHEWGELDRDADRVEESTRRLALCNMDWDRIRATDIMVLLNSFVPPGGVIHSVTIYPSEFGLERMKLEEERGPLELYGNNEGSDQEANDDNKYQMEKLRQYQLTRLRYYYAIIECDTVATADHLYKECDGREYESSATRLDLRFVPDDTTFDQEPKERCTETPDVRKYKPRNFLTTALQQSKVDLTWDETDPDRAALTSRVASGDIDDDDLKAYLASSTDDSEEESAEEDINKYKKAVKQVESNAVEDEESIEENEGGGGDENSNLGSSGDSEDSDDETIAKYRRALESTAAEEEEERKDVQMEISWDVGRQKAAEEAVKKKLEEKEERTPFEEMLHRRREKQKEKKREKAKEKGEEVDDDASDTSEDYVPADVDLDDPYFKEEYDKLEKKKKKRKEKESEEDSEKKKWAQLRSNKKLNQKKTRRELEEQAARESNFKVDVNDQRFSALYTSHLFNIDPTDPNFRKTSGVEALINEKLERRAKQSDPSKIHEAASRLQEGSTHKTTSSKGNSENSELSALVSSVKNKAQIFRNAKKRKLNE